MIPTTEEEKQQPLILSAAFNSAAMKVETGPAPIILEDVDQYFELLDNEHTIEMALTKLNEISGKQTLHLQSVQIEKLIQILDPQFEAFGNVKRLVLVLLDDIISSSDENSMAVIMNCANLQIYLDAFADLFRKKQMQGTQGVNATMIKCAEFISNLIKKDVNCGRHFVDIGLFELIKGILSAGLCFEECITCIRGFSNLNDYPDFAQFIVPYLLRFVVSSEDDDLKSVCLTVIENLCQNNPDFTQSIISHEAFAEMFQNVDDDLAICELLDFLTIINIPEVLQFTPVHEFIINAITSFSCMIEAVNFLYSICFNETFSENFDQELYSALVECLTAGTRYDIKEKIVTIICIVLINENPPYIDQEMVISGINETIDTAKGSILHVMIKTILGLLIGSSITGMKDYINDSSSIRDAFENIASNPELIGNDEELLTAIEEYLDGSQ